MRRAATCLAVLLAPTAQTQSRALALDIGGAVHADAWSVLLEPMSIGPATLLLSATDFRGSRVEQRARSAGVRVYPLVIAGTDRQRRAVPWLGAGFSVVTGLWTPPCPGGYACAQVLVRENRSRATLEAGLRLQPIRLSPFVDLGVRRAATFTGHQTIAVAALGIAW